MKTNIWKQTLLVVWFLVVFCAGYAVLANPGKIWVPVIGTEQPREGEPELKIMRSDAFKLDIKMVTRGFFVNEREENLQTYHVLKIGRYHGDLSPGSPNLPTLRRYIHIPKGKTVRIHVNPGSPVTFDNYRVYPVQEPQMDSKDAVDPGFYIDDTIYRWDRFFPSELVFIEESQTLRGHCLALLHICPFRYNPQREVLEVYPGIEVNITFAGKAEPVDGRLYSPVFDNFIKGFVLNPGAFSGYKAGQENGGDEGAQFLIIAAPDFLNPGAELRDHKESMGICTVVKTTTDTGTTSTQIKNYIQNAYNTWSPAPSYVLLLGDVETIPTTYQTTISRGTDLYYSTVDGTDYEPDIFIGRIPVDTLFEAETVIQKIINYESNPPGSGSFYTNAAVAAYFQDYNNYDGYEDRRFVRTSEEVRDFLLNLGYDVERIYYTESYVTPTHYNDGYYGSGEPLPAELLKANGFAWNGCANDISSAINSGVFLLMHRDHGMDRNGGYSHTGWGDPYFVETHVEALTNGDLLPVVMSINCQTGWFDGETDTYTTRNYESFCELFLRKSGGGAVGVFGATRNSYSGYNDFLAEGFIDCVWPDFLTAVPNNSGSSSRLGPMLNHGKIAMDILWGDAWGLRQTEYELFHVFGDPTMRMWVQKMIIITSPNGGEDLKRGDLHHITWSAPGITEPVKITLWKDGDFVGIIADELDPSSGSYPWVVGEFQGGTALAGSGYTIKIKEKGTTYSDFSNGPFTISNSIKITSPNGGENWMQGETQDITWEAHGISDTVKITLWKDDILQGTIVEDLDPYVGTYSWPVGDYQGGPASAGTGYKVKIKEKGTTVCDYSDGCFTISEPPPPSITVITPNGGEDWPLHSMANITWSAVNLSETVKITLWKNGVLIGTIAENIDPIAGSYSWLVGSYNGGTVNPCSGYTVKIKEKGTTVYDTSDAPFTINEALPASITVINPNGGNSLGLRENYYITWTAVSLTETVKITLWKDDALVGTIASELDPYAGSYLWTVGEYEGGMALPGTGYKIKIKEKGTTVSDFSDTGFEIVDNGRRK